MVKQLNNSHKFKEPISGVIFVGLSVASFVAITFFHQKELFVNLCLGSRDLSFFSQSLWNFIHGNGLRTTIGLHGHHLFSEHFYLSHVLLSGVYFFWSSPVALLFIQGTMLGLSGVAIYRIARIRGLESFTSILIAFLLLSHPSYHGAASGMNLYGYHPDCLFPVFFLFAYESHLRKRQTAFWIFVVMALGSLEQSVIVLSALGVYWFFAGSRKVGIKLAAVSITWYVVATKIAMPLIGGSTPYYWGVLRNPENFTNLLWEGSAAIKYSVRMLLYWGALPLLSAFSLVALPSILIYAQADSVGYNIPLNVLSWHALPVVSVWAISSVHAIQYLSKKYGNYIKWIRAGLAVCCLVLAWISFNEVYDQKIQELSDEQQYTLQQLKNKIPGQASMSANFFVASHFANRKNLFIFPKIADADYVLISKHEKWEFHHSEFKVLNELQNSKDFFLAFEQAGFLLYQKTQQDK